MTVTCVDGLITYSISYEKLKEKFDYYVSHRVIFDK